jgi:hypothetical protein
VAIRYPDDAEERSGFPDLLPHRKKAALSFSDARLFAIRFLLSLPRL